MNNMEFLIYRNEQDDVSVNAMVQNETIWLTQKGMAELFGIQVPAISKHLHNIFEEGELGPEVVISKMETITNDGTIVKVNDHLVDISDMIRGGVAMSDLLISTQLKTISIQLEGLTQLMIKSLMIQDADNKEEYVKLSNLLKENSVVPSDEEL